MNKRTLIIVLGSFTALLFAVMYLTNPPEDNSPQLPEGVTFPIPTDRNQPLTSSVRTQDGQLVTVRDFLSDEDVENWPDDAATYLLDEDVKDSFGAPLYQIFYYARDNTIGVSLQHEALNEARQRAEAALQTRLGVTQEELCTLAIRVSVPNFVSSYYSGLDLGISGCPGSVVLPSDAGVEV